MGDNEIEWGLKMITGDAILNIDLVLHHPGYYYLFAANCIRQKHAKLAGREVHSPFLVPSLYHWFRYCVGMLDFSMGRES